MSGRVLVMTVGLDEVTLIAEARPAGDRGGALGHAGLQEPGDPPQLLLGNSGPICVPDSMPGPSLMPLAISATPLTTSSKRSSWTKSREPATQHWPWVKKIALAAPSTAPVSAFVEHDCWGSCRRARA